MAENDEHMPRMCSTYVYPIANAFLTNLLSNPNCVCVEKYSIYASVSTVGNFHYSNTDAHTHTQML